MVYLAWLLNSLTVFFCRDSDLPLIVAIDLQPMAPIDGVIQVQGDITNARTAEVVKFYLTLVFKVSNTIQTGICQLVLTYS